VHIFASPQVFEKIPKNRKTLSTTKSGENMSSKIFTRVVMITGLTLGLVIMGVTWVQGQEQQPQGEPLVTSDQTLSADQPMVPLGTVFRVVPQ
jgi:hypothetical protein